MTHVLAPHVEETATSNTTVSFTLTGATAGNRRVVAVAAIGDTLDYSARDGSGNWENARGTFIGSNTLNRPAAVEAGSNGLAPVTFSGAVTVTHTQNVSTIVRARGPKMAAMGDSLIAGVYGWGTGLGYVIPFTSSGVWQFLLNNAISGQNSDAILARAFTDTFPYGADVVVIMMGTNDPGSNYQLTIPIAAAQVRSLGALALVLTLSPIGADKHGGPANTYNGGSAAILTKNAWIRSWAASVTDPGIILADVNSILDDGTGQWLYPADTIDGLHWSSLGATKAAGVCNAALAPFAPLAPFMSRPNYSGSANYYQIVGGFFDQGTPTAGLAAGWANSNAACVTTIVAPVAGDAIAGNWQRIVLPAGQSTYLTSGSTVGVLVALRSRKVRLSMRVRISGIDTTQSTGNYSGVFTSLVSNYVGQGSIPLYNVNFNNQTIHADMVLSAAATDCNVSIQLINVNTTGSMTVDLAEILFQPLELGTVVTAQPDSFTKIQYVTTAALTETGQNQLLSVQTNSGDLAITLPTFIPGRIIRVFREGGIPNSAVKLLTTSGQPINAGATTTMCCYANGDSYVLQGIEYGWGCVEQSVPRALETGGVDFMLRIPVGCRLESLVLTETAGRAITGGIVIGTTSGASDVLATTAVGANAVVDIVAASLLKRAFSATVEQLLYVHATAWNGASLTACAQLSKFV